MRMESRNEMERAMLSPQVRQKFDELVALLAEERYPDGPPIDTTFAEIESFGHQAGRMLGRSLDEHLTYDHAEHYQQASCPTCGAHHESDTARSKTRPLETIDGKIPLAEPAFHCPKCNRDFFPSAERTCD